MGNEMRICPKCKKVYDDSWGVCLNDRTQLMLITGEDEKKMAMLKLENDNKQNYENKENWVVIGFSLLLGLMILWIVLFLAIANSDLYYEPRVEAGPLLLYIVYSFTLFPIFILNCFVSTAMIITACKHKKYGLAVVAAFAFMFILAISIFSSSIYDKVMTTKIRSLGTKTIITSKSKAIKYFSHRILKKRQSELLQILKENHDSLSNYEIGKFFTYLSENPDPIIDQCAMKLFKGLVAEVKGWPYYATYYLELLLRRSHLDIDLIRKELYEFADKVIDDKTKLETFKKEFEVFVKRYGKYKD